MPDRTWMTSFRRIKIARLVDDDERSRNGAAWRRLTVDRSRSGTPAARALYRPTDGNPFIHLSVTLSRLPLINSLVKIDRQCHLCLR